MSKVWTVIKSIGSTIQRFWWIGALLTVLSAVIMAFASRKKSPQIADLAIKLLEAAHKPHIEDLNKQISTLNKRFDDEADQAEHLERELARRRAELEKAYARAGLPADEIVDRLARLAV